MVLAFNCPDGIVRVLAFFWTAEGLLQTRTAAGVTRDSSGNKKFDKEKSQRNSAFGRIDGAVTLAMSFAPVLVPDKRVVSADSMFFV